VEEDYLLGAWDGSMLTVYILTHTTVLRDLLRMMSVRMHLCV